MKIEVDVNLDAEVAAKVEGLEKALTLTGNSREWNRKRVVELEDELERATGDRPSVRDSLAGQVVRLEKSLAESRELVQEERIRANNLSQRLAQAERELAHVNSRLASADQAWNDALSRIDKLIRGMNENEALNAQVASDKDRSLAAREHLLVAATSRINAARELLSARRVEEAADTIVTSKGAIMADAIRNALAALA